MALFIDVGPGDALRVGDSYVTIERKSGARSRLRIVGPEEVELLRDLSRDSVAALVSANIPRPVNQSDEE